MRFVVILVGNCRVEGVAGAGDTLDALIVDLCGHPDGAPLCDALAALDPRPTGPGVVPLPVQSGELRYHLIVA